MKVRGCTVKRIETLRSVEVGRPQRLEISCGTSTMIHKTVLAAGVFAALFWLTFGASSLASPITLADENSTVTLDPSTSSGVSSWTVDGVNQLYQQWFW